MPSEPSQAAAPGSSADPSVGRRTVDHARSGPPITVSIDLEDHRPSPSWEARYPALMRRLLDHLDGHGARATVFVVGEVARRSPELVAEVAARGHEVGVHSWRHHPLFTEEPARYRREITDARARVEDIAGVPVRGFRAPAGTLTPASYWVTELLAEAGFAYSASVLPARSIVIGFPGCPATPFRWPSGVAELPCPVVQVRGAGTPFMGGTFLRLMPVRLVDRLLARADGDAVLWTYLHPYDIDTDERFWILPDVGLWGSPLVWANRRAMLRRLDAVVTGRTAAPLGERLDALGELPTWTPGPDARSLSSVLPTVAA